MYEHLEGMQEIFDETRQLLDAVALSIAIRSFRSKGGEMTSSFLVNTSHPGSQKLKDNLTLLYHNEGIGFKLLSSILGNVSYTRLRTIFRKLGIETRIGTRCVTDGLKKVRSERAKKNNPWKDWAGNDDLSGMHKFSKKYLGGWYFNNSKKKQVWLRSSWEYAYASFLDTSNRVWDVEVRSYLLKDGRYYRPDFFLYESEKLDHIVEIKSTWTNGAVERIDKFELFKEEYPGIDAKIIMDNELFELVGRTPRQVLVEWKQIRKMEKFHV